MPSAHATTVVTGTSPVAIAVNSATNKIYVVGNAMTVINGATLATTTVAAGGNSVAVNSATNKIYVTNGSGTLTVVDGATNATTTVPLGVFNSIAIAVNQATNKIYIANGNTSGTVSVVDGVTNAVTTVPVGPGPAAGGIAVNSTTNQIYVALSQARAITVIDGATNATTTVNVASASVGIAIDAVTNKIYCASVPVTVVDGATNATTTVATGPIPLAIAVNSSTNMIYVAAVSATGSIALSQNATVTAIDGLTNTPTSIAVGVFPAALAVNPATNTVYVANEFGNNATEINGPANTTTTIAAGVNPSAIAVNPVTNQYYILNSGDGTVTVGNGPLVTTPVITMQPSLVSPTLTIDGTLAGTTVVLALTATNATSYQWKLNGANVTQGNASGATGPTLLITGAKSLNAGTYTCLVSNASSSVTSNPVAVTTASPSSPGRLVNLSVLTTAGTGSQPFTVGFFTGGAGTSGQQTLLIRGDGPALTAFGVGSILSDPVIKLFQSSNSALVATNDNWGTPSANQTAVSAADAATFAFPLTIGSLDAALVSTLSPGGYSVQVTGNGNGVGNAIAEVYDDTAVYTASSTRLYNLSCLAQVNAGAVLTAGFVVGGTTAKTVLVRVTGPALIPLGVSGTMPDPQLTLHHSVSGQDTVLAANAGWGGNPQITAVDASVFAFALTNANSADSAFLVTLPPGNYSAQATSVSGAAGTVLIEVYEVP